MKHKRLWMITALTLALCVMAGLGFWAAAESPVPTVTYTDGSAPGFSFSNTGGGADSDLFPAFQNCMPGDTRTQTIRVRAARTNAPGGARIYLHAEIDGGASAGPGSALTNADVLRHISVTVADAGTSAVLASNRMANLLAAQSAPHGLRGGVPLGEVTPGGAPLELTVTIAIDPDMGNAFQETAGHIVWVFSAQNTENPAPPPLEREAHNAYLVGYTDGTIHPAAPITRAEVATVFFRLLTDEARGACWTQANPYTDVPAGAWHCTAVSTLTRAGVLGGYPDGTFGPGKSITRAEFAVIATRFFPAEDVGGADVFPDISRHWARRYINQAAALGLVEGYENGTFRPEASITRAEAIAIVNRVLGRAPAREGLLDGMLTWSDNANTGAWYYAAIQEATNSHAYTRKTAADGTVYEVWTALLPNRDWSALEREP